MVVTIRITRAPNYDDENGMCVHSALCIAHCLYVSSTFKEVAVDPFFLPTPLSGG